MSTLHVRLADAPTDALVHLVDNGPATISQLSAAIAPPETISPNAIISYAIDLLRRIGYVCSHGDAYQWAATDSGRAAVHTARAAQATP